MAEKSGGKVKWKAILAVVLVLAILGFVFFTGFLNQYFPQLGQLNLGSLTGFIVNQKPATSFPFSLTAANTAFFGQQYKVVNGSLDTTGVYQYINAGNLNLESKQGKRITIALRNFNGDFQISAGGSIILKGTATYAEFGDIAASPDKTIAVQMEIIPTTYSLTSLQLNTVTFSGITGTLQRGSSDNPDTINLSNNVMTISYFVGGLSQQEDGTTVLQGIASSIKGDNFSFV